MITTPGRLTASWLLAGVGLVALSATEWSGSARPWDGNLELWRWTVWLTGAAAVAALWVALGPAHLRFTAATVGAVLALVSTAMWLRQWWLLAFPQGPVVAFTAPVSSLDSLRSPSGTLTWAGYAAGALLIVAAAASLVTAARLARRPAQPAG